ncbi:MAG: tol-pal system protein YbgF [Gammaproteobacteria bacterium]
MTRLRIAGLLLVAVTTGCSMGTREDDPLYLRTIEIDNRLTRVERLLDNDGLVNLLSRLDVLQQDVQQMRNDMDTLQNNVEQANGRQRELYLDVDKRLQSIERSTIRNDDMTVLEGGELNPGQLPVPGGTDRANYQAAFELLKQGRYDEASIALKQFMVAFPSSSLGDNAQYWLAETYYVSQDYAQALPEFQKVLDRFPDSRKLPDALLKIGYCNYELTRWDAARQALSAVVSDYSETTAARLANQRLERLQSEGR